MHRDSMLRCPSQHCSSGPIQRVLTTRRCCCKGNRVRGVVIYSRHTPALPPSLSDALLRSTTAGDAAAGDAAAGDAAAGDAAAGDDVDAASTTPGTPSPSRIVPPPAREYKPSKSMAAPYSC
jgi:hypothetical protein